MFKTRIEAEKSSKCHAVLAASTVLAMATIADLSYDVLSLIIILLVQSSDGAAQLARILSVSKTFLVFKQDVHILKEVRFERKCCNYQMPQKINRLVVRCSEAGSISAQCLLGKAILLNFRQFMGKRLKRNLAQGPYVCASPSRTLATKDFVQNTTIGSLISYFLPSEASQTRLVHYQLVKVFLLRCSYRELLTMGVPLITYIRNFRRVTKEESTLLHSVYHLLSYAFRLRRREEVIESRKRFDDCLQVCRELDAKYEEERRSKWHDDPSSSSTLRDLQAIAKRKIALFALFRSKCLKAVVDWREALNAEYYEDRHREAFIDFSACRDQTLLHYDSIFS